MPEMDYDLLVWIVLAVLAIYELNDIARRLGRIDQAIRNQHGSE